MIQYHKWRTYDRLAVDLTIILDHILVVTSEELGGGQCGHGRQD